MTKKNLHHMREQYDKARLSLSDVPNDPYVLFNDWFNEALKKHAHEANAMTIASCGSDGKPSTRIVLLKEYSVADGFIFYTNYNSRKGKQLKENPNASIQFFWPELQQQVRIEGEVVKITEAKSKAYFNSRPKQSQIGAIASPQSEEIKEGFLEQAFEEAKALSEIQKPPHWGGYALLASYFEFWQGRPNRLHDRVTYTKKSKNWSITRIAP